MFDNPRPAFSLQAAGFKWNVAWLILKRQRCKEKAKYQPERLQLMQRSNMFTFLLLFFLQQSLTPISLTRSKWRQFLQHSRRSRLLSSAWVIILMVTSNWSIPTMTMEFDHVFNRISIGFQPGFNQVLMPKVRQRQTSEKISKAIPWFQLERRK